MHPNKHLIVIVGPTAIGKTALAIELARNYQTEILSADSRQFYREMNIGTAKPSPEELAQATHHFINSHSITEEFTVGDFEQQAVQLLDRLFADRQTVVLAGGSGLFVNAVIKGFDDLPKAPAEVRQELNTLLQEKGISVLQDKLKELDPDYYTEVDLRNPQRIIRALEVSIFTGAPFSSYRTRQTARRPFNIIQIGLNLPREILYGQINSRVDRMIGQGLVEEVRSLAAYRNLNPLNTVGYSEIFDYLDGRYSLEDAVSAIKQNTRRFAKRQLTWFRKDPGTEWFTPDQLPDIINYINSRITPAR
ncbi:MAG TPA: tRNA (adenosine(37)-N6)-dimethylallyltransferase MiaA [Sphingobacteriaceae bacterium]